MTVDELPSLRIVGVGCPSLTRVAADPVLRSFLWGEEMAALQLCVDLTEEIRNLHPRLHMEGAQEVVAIDRVQIS